MTFGNKTCTSVTSKGLCQKKEYQENACQWMPSYESTPLKDIKTEKKVAEVHNITLQR